jgi:hypothetical protein
VEPIIEEVDLFAGRTFSTKQAGLFDWYREQRARRLAGESFEHILAVVWGRRCGKSVGCTALFTEIVIDTLLDLAARVESGDLDPWAGIGQPRMLAKRATPHARCFVVAPTGRDLRELAGFILGHLGAAGERFLHSDPKMRFDASTGASMLLVHEGAAVAVDFVPATRASAMVGRGVAAALFSESGFVESQHWEKFAPALWDSKGWAIVEGTPKQDATHFLTKLAVAGLDDDDDDADRTIAERDPRVHTSRASTTTDAYLATAREGAADEERYRGKAWADTWVRASWKAPSNVVFSEFSPDASVVEFQPRPVPKITRGDGSSRTLPWPDRVEMFVDWSQGAAPGALTTIYVWPRNPLDPKDPRALWLVVGEFMDDKERLQYVNAPGQWFDVMMRQRDDWGAKGAFADPSSPNLIRAAKRAGFYVQPAANADKPGRIELVNAQCHVPRDGGWPALLISDTCGKLINALRTVSWRRTREGELTREPSAFNLHLPDTLAYCAARWGHGTRRTGRANVPGFLQAV